MRNKETVVINLYRLDGLEEEAKRKAIEEHMGFLIDVYSDDDYDESFNMTRAKYAKSLTRRDVIESIEINDYMYFFNGEMANTIQYCGKHPRSGEHELTLNGESYLLNSKEE